MQKLIFTVTLAAALAAPLAANAAALSPLAGPVCNYEVDYNNSAHVTEQHCSAAAKVQAGGEYLIIESFHIPAGTVAAATVVSAVQNAFNLRKKNVLTATGDGVVTAVFIDSNPNGVGRWRFRNAGKLIPGVYVDASAYRLGGAQ